MNPQIQGCMEKIREMDVSEKKKIQLCNVLGGIENTNNEEAKLEEWYEFLDLFYNDPSIIEEIYKKMKTNGLCFLHEVGIYFDKDDDKPDFYVLKNAGKPNQTTLGEWNPQMYYETNIRDCKQKLMAIPIALTGKNRGHSNMLIIRKKKQKNPIKNMGAYLNKTIIKKEENKTTWEIEHFEPHGKQDEDEERHVNKAIVNLVHDILKHDAEYNKDNIKITHPNQLCKLTRETNEVLQQILQDTKYRGSCTIFSMWYSFNRLLYPEKESAQIYREMNDTLLSSKNPSETIENIILSFVSLINIDINSFKIGNDRFLLTLTQKEIKNNLGLKNPIISGITLKSGMFNQNETTLKSNKEIHFLNCILPWNCLKWAEHNATIEIIEIVDCDYDNLNKKFPFSRLFCFIDCPHLKHLTFVGSIDFERFNVDTIGWILNHEDLESVNFGNNHIQPDVANAILDTIKKFKKNLKSFNILDDNNEDPELKQIQDEINELLNPQNPIVMKIKDKINELLTEQNPKQIQDKINELLTQQKSIELNIILGEINRLLTHQSPVEVMKSQDKINILLTEQNPTKLKQIHDEINELLAPDNLGRGLKKRKQKTKRKNEKRKKQKKEKTKNNYKRNI